MHDTIHFNLLPPTALEGYLIAMTHPRFTPLSHALPSTVPFVGPETMERQQGAPFDLRLGANESVFGPSPKAIKAMSKTGHWMYGDPENHDLRTALATKHGCSIDNIVVGEGIDGLLGYLVRLLVGPKDRVVTSLGAYPTFNYHVAGFGGVLHNVPYRADFHEDPVALLTKAHETGAKLIYLANPDNPMGTAHGPNVIQRMLDGLPDGCVLALDEAYCDFMETAELPVIDANDPRVIRMRTFSKAHGMAGARIGYAIATPQLAQAFNKVRNHFGVSRAAQEGALAALNDDVWLADVRSKVATVGGKISTMANDLGLTALPSKTNFIAIDCGTTHKADAILASLVDQGIFVRKPMVDPLSRFVRLSIGHAKDLPKLKSALTKAVAEK